METDHVDFAVDLIEMRSGVCDVRIKEVEDRTCDGVAVFISHARGE
jgi:hypothetical protein